MRVGRVFLLGLLLLATVPFTGCGGQEVWVERAIDGDTIVLQGGERVRYIGIDAPEMDEPFGREAWRTNRELVEGKRVRLERDISERDRYGRLLRYVFVGELLVEGELVRNGLARAKAYPPDTKYQARLQALEEEAQEARRGLWGASSLKPALSPP